MIGEQCRSLISSLFSFLHSPIISFLLGTNVLLYIVFSNTLYLRSYLDISDQVSHPYKTACKITEFYFHDLFLSVFKKLDIYLRT